MSTPTRRRFIDIKSFSHGATTSNYNTIKSISVDEQTSMILDAADDDKFDSFMATGMGKISLSMEIGDPVQRAALGDAITGTTKFIGTPEDGGTPYTVTITNTKWHSKKLQASHSGSNQPWRGNLSGSAYAPDGQTNPVSIAP